MSDNNVPSPIGGGLGCGESRTMNCPHPSPLPEGEGTRGAALPLGDGIEKNATQWFFCQPAGLVGISETGNFLQRRLNMIQSKSTWKRRWKILALLAVLCIGIATLTDAQEKRKAAEIQAEIETLQAELREAQEAEGIVVINDQVAEPTVEFYPVTEENRMFIVNTLSFLVPNVRSSMDKNRFAVIGSKSDHAKVKEMLAKLQQAEKEPEQNVAPEWARKDDIMCAYSLNGINKEKALRLLSSLKGLLMKLDEERNMLLVFGSEVMHSNVKELLGQVATEPAIQPLQPLIPTDEQVGHRPPGGAVGESRPEPDTFNSSAEYRTLPPGGRQPTSAQPQSWNRSVWARQAVLAPPQEELVFRTYPHDLMFKMAVESIPNWKVRGEYAHDSKLVFIVGRKFDIEKLEAILAQMKESQESEEKAIAENKPILRRYKYPVGLLLGDDVFVSLIKELVGKNTAVGTENTGTTIETASVVIWALKSDQDKVKAMLEQITKATEKVLEDGRYTPTLQ